MLSLHTWSSWLGTGLRLMLALCKECTYAFSELGAFKDVAAAPVQRGTSSPKHSAACWVLAEAGCAFKCWTVLSLSSAAKPDKSDHPCSSPILPHRP